MVLLLVSQALVSKTYLLIARSVESQGRTLEQLEWVYNQPNPVKASKQVQKVAVADDGTVQGRLDED